MNTLRSSSFAIKRLLPYRLPNRCTFRLPSCGLLTSYTFRGFSYSASWQGRENKEDASNPFNALITRNDTQIAADQQKLDNIEDRFHLSQIHDVKKVFSLLRQANYKYPLNDLVHFLRRIIEINEEKHLNLSTRNSTELSSFVREIKRNLMHANQEYPLIGSYAWCFQKLNYQEDSDLWLTLGDHIIDGRFYPNFQESLCGIEGFTALDGIADQKFIDEVYKKLERVLVLTIMEVNITHYKRIAESLIKVHRFSEYVFESVESHLMHFISSHTLTYDLKLMLDILSAFAISGNGSEHLFYSFQHIFNSFSELNAEQQQELSHGDFISKMVQTYALAKMKHPDLVYDETFSKLVHWLVIGNEAHYSLEELVNVVQHIGMFNFESIDEINKLLDKRLFEVKGVMKSDDMIRYIDLKTGRDYDDDYSKLPKEIMTFFDAYLNVYMDKQEPNQVYYFTTEVEARDLMNGKEQLFNHIIIYVGNKLHIYDFEELCYFYWLFNKYHNMIDMSNAQVKSSLTQTKDHIRLNSAFSKGKLSIGSNFYKMLEVVSGSDFLSQGEYPEW